MDHTSSTSTELIKAAPAIGFLGSFLVGVEWGQLASFLACVYTAGLLIQQTYRFYRWVKYGPLKRNGD